MDIFNSSKVMGADGEKPDVPDVFKSDVVSTDIDDTADGAADLGEESAARADAEGIDTDKVEEIMNYFSELRNAADSEASEDETADFDDEDASATEKVQMEMYDWIQCFVAALICGVLTFIFIGRTIGVDGSSMVDTLRDNDRVVMHNLMYTPKKGDIVVFQSKAEERFHDIPLVKRVIATGGDLLDIDFNTGAVYINGKEIYEPYIHTLTTASHGFEGPVRIPEGFIFVMGDNRNNSSDSRDSDVGLVDTRYILGRVVFLLIPGESHDQPRDWSRFGVVR